MKTVEDRIQFYRQDTLNFLRHEIEEFSNGGVEYWNWYSSPEDVRKYILSVIQDYKPSWEHPYVLHSHRIDHHIYGYVAPMEILRKSFLGQIRTPAEHLAHLSQQFKSNGIRFIYAALPCKKAVYPEIILPDDLLRQVSVNIIPQWRHMIYDLICHGVEVVDFYPYFLRYRENNRLFSYGHDISCTGAILIGNILGTYLLDTTTGIEWEKVFSTRVCSVKEDNIDYQTDQILYKASAEQAAYCGTEVNSEIGIFGNCNLQKYRGYGVDITAQLSNTLSYPVSYLGRLLPFDPTGQNEVADVPDGTFFGKKIVIYLGFPSAAFVRSPQVNGAWATKVIPDRCFREA